MQYHHQKWTFFALSLECLRIFLQRGECGHLIYIRGIFSLIISITTVMNVPKPLLTKQQTFVGSYIEWLWLAKWMLIVFKSNLLALTASPDSWECFAPLALPGQGLGNSQLWLPRPRPSLTTPQVWGPATITSIYEHQRHTQYSFTFPNHRM